MLRTSGTIAVNETLGSITEVRIANCTGGSVERVLSLPWPLTLRAVPSGLPDSATSFEVNIVGFAINFSTFFEIPNCLYRGTAAAILSLNDTGTDRYTTGLLRFNEAVTIPFIRGSEACLESLAIRGSASFVPTQAIVIR